MKERAPLSFSEISILYYFSASRGKAEASRGSVWRFGLHHGHTENREFRARLILHSRVFSLLRKEKSTARLVCKTDSIRCLQPGQDKARAQASASSGPSYGSHMTGPARGLLTLELGFQIFFTLACALR